MLLASVRHRLLSYDQVVSKSLNNETVDVNVIFRVSCTYKTKNAPPVDVNMTDLFNKI